MPKSVRSEKYRAAEQSLPEELWPIFESLVDEYGFHATATYGHHWVAYKVLAGLVRDGWRPTAKPHQKVDQEVADKAVFADGCGYCGADPNEFCCTPTGTKPKPRAKPHAERVKRAGYKLVDDGYERI